MRARKPKNYTQWLLVVSTLIIMLGWFIFTFTQTSVHQDREPSSRLDAVRTQATSPPQTNTTPVTITPSTPVQLTIPDIGLNAKVLAVGTDKSGEMSAPRGKNDIGWYRSGYLPGAKGNAVLAGHFMHTDGQGAFYDLDELRAGDTVRLITETSDQYYKVTGSKVIAAEETSLEQVFGPSDTAELQLVTCKGAWDAETRKYSDRLVVSAAFQYERVRKR